MLLGRADAGETGGGMGVYAGATAVHVSSDLGLERRRKTVGLVSEVGMHGFPPNASHAVTTASAVATANGALLRYIYSRLPPPVACDSR